MDCNIPCGVDNFKIMLSPPPPPPPPPPGRLLEGACTPWCLTHAFCLAKSLGTSTLHCCRCCRGRTEGGQCGAAPCFSARVGTEGRHTEGGAERPPTTGDTGVAQVGNSGKRGAAEEFCMLNAMGWIGIRKRRRTGRGQQSPGEGGGEGGDTEHRSQLHGEGCA